MMTKIKNKGLGILEVLIAALIFAGAVWGLLSFEASATRERNIVNQKNEALRMVTDKMHYFRSFTTLTTTPGQLAYADIVTCASGCAGSTSVYALTWGVTTVASPPYKDVTITATWTDPQNATQTVSIRSYIAGIDPATSGRAAQNL